MKNFCTTALAMTALLGCDALVGGICADGYAVKDGSCALIQSDAHGDGGAGGEGQGGDIDDDESSGGAGGALLPGTGGSTPVDTCTGDQWMCGGQCVDLDSDAYHCGACFNACATQLCVEGQCKGGPTGHVVVAGMSYASSTQAARRILGNAVFLPTPQTVRILDYRAHADVLVVPIVEDIIDEQASLRGRAHAITIAPTAGAVNAWLDVADYDVLFIHDQPAMPVDEPDAFTKKAGEAVLRFFEDGGTVVVLAAAPVMAELLSVTQLFPTLGLESITGGTVHKSAPTDALSVGVSAPMLATEATRAIVTDEVESTLLSFVFESEAAQPVVIHRVVDVVP